MILTNNNKMCGCGDLGFYIFYIIFNQPLFSKWLFKILSYKIFNSVEHSLLINIAYFKLI
jgi:TRAP-type mannitol/chloroaromatic compound transport system permease large subunit